MLVKKILIFIAAMALSFGLLYLGSLAFFSVFNWVRRAGSDAITPLAIGLAVLFAVYFLVRRIWRVHKIDEE